MPSLFELPYPFSTMRSRMRTPSPFAAARMGQVATQQPDYDLSDQQRESVLKGLGRKALSGVGMVGNLLDVPGSMVRDLLGGQNPLDQLLSPFSSDNRTSSRDLMESAGILGRNKPGFDFGDMAGFVGDIALDPLTYVTLGASALSKGGRVAKAAGLLDDATKVAGTIGKREARLTTSLDDLLKPGRFATTAEETAARTAADTAASKIGTSVAEVGGEKLGGMFGVGLPFMDPIATFGRGGMSQKLARGMDVIGQAIKASLPVRVARAGFDPRVMNAIDPLEQKLAELTHAKKPMGQYAAESQAWDVTREVEDAYGGLKPQLDAAFQTSPLQGMDPHDVFQRMLRHTVETQGNVDEALQRFYGPNGATVGMAERQQIQDLATNLSKAKNEPYDAFMSKGGSGQYLPEDADFAHYPRYVEVAGKDPSKFRSKYVKTEGPATAHRRVETKQIPTDVVREMLTDPNLQKATAADLMNNPSYSRYLRDGWKTGDATKAGESASDHADALASYIRSRWGDELYTRGPTEDMARYLSSVHRMDQSLEALHEFWADDIVRGAGQGGNRVSVPDAFKELGLNDISGQNYLSGILKRPAGSETVSRAAVDAAKRLMQPNKHPSSEFGKAVGDFIDNGLRWFKNSVTLPFPSFWSRNYTSGQYMNLADGVVPLADFSKYAEMHRKAWNLWRNPDPDTLRELESLRIYGSKMGFEDVDYTMFGAKGALPGNPLDVGKTFGEAQANVAANDVLLDVIPGWKSARVAGQTVGGTGAKVNQIVEWMNRVPLYLYLTEKKGWDKFRAAMEVKKLHFDYGDLTEFERTYMKRVFPFYCVPDHSEALTRDGWKTWDQIESSDELLTYNVDDDVFEWQPCEEVAVFAHDQDLLKWESKRHSLEFTDEHRWPVLQSASEVVLANGETKKYPQLRKVVTGTKLRTTHSFICAATIRETESLLTPDQAELLGWIVTDGHVRCRAGYWEAVIYQHPKKFLPEIISMTGSEPRAPHPDTGVVQINVPIILLRPLIPYLDKNNLTKVVTRLSTEAATRMYDAMYKADGVTSANRHQDFFAAEHEGVRQAFRILGTMLGKMCSESNRGCYVSPRRTMKLATGKIRRSHYSGIVWCPRTANGTWVMRQGKTIVVTGNTFSRKVAPLLAQQLAERPGGIIAQSVKTPARQRSDLQITPDYVSETMALPAGTLPDGSQRYVTGFGMPWEDPLSFLGGGVRGGLLEGASRMNPLTKAPIEWMTNQTLFQKGPSGGRPLEDLDPTLGRIISNIKQAVTGEETPRAKPLLGSQALEFAVANSPLTRFATTARQMTDQRKWGVGGLANLLTGVRVSDISPASQDAILRERAQEAWKKLGARPFIRMSVPAEERLKMGSAEGLASDQLKAILDEIGVRTQTRKKQRMAQPRKPG